jgi:hypothetical protein
MPVTNIVEPRKRRVAAVGGVSLANPARPDFRPCRRKPSHRFV